MTRFFSRNLKRAYPTVKSAQGVWITDADGRTYLDGASGAVAANLGHGLTEINDAIQEQLSRVAFAHTSQFVSEPALRLADKLIELAPPSFHESGRAYFASGGSEAIETALKLARAYFVQIGQTERHIIISRQKSYHGSTQGALSITGHPARRKPYIELLKEIHQVSAAYPYRCPCGSGPGPCASDTCCQTLLDQLEQLILLLGPEKVMAFVGEPIVGAALGACVPYEGYWKRIRSLCTKYGVLLIADEVMTGLGRAGANFALERLGAEADIIAVGKGLAAGYMPLSAVIASSRVVDAFERGDGVFEHGFTYSGHPVSCAAGLAAVEYLNAHSLVAKVKERERKFFSLLDDLKRHEFVGDIRGMGFLSGIEFVAKRDSKQPFPSSMKVSQIVAREAADRGLLVYPGSAFLDDGRGDHVIVAPPLTISDDEMGELIKRLDMALAASMQAVAAISG